MRPREDDTTATPPHGDTLHGGAAGAASGGEPAGRHGVQLDARGEPENAVDAPRDGTPSTPRSAPTRGDTP
jgi:hypothetical protein